MLLFGWVGWNQFLRATMDGVLYPHPPIRIAVRAVWMPMRHVGAACEIKTCDMLGFGTDGEPSCLPKTQGTCRSLGYSNVTDYSCPLCAHCGH